jgi:hypothetical protein
MNPSHAAWYSQTVRDLLTKEEIAGIMQKSDARGLGTLKPGYAAILRKSIQQKTNPTTTT